MRAKIVKNKVAPPFRQAEFDIEYGVGISSEGCVLDLGIEHGIVQKSGAFFSYDGERLGQGRNNAKAFLRENPATTAEIEAKVYEALGIERAGVPVAVADPRAGRERRRSPSRRPPPSAEPSARPPDAHGRLKLPHPPKPSQGPARPAHDRAEAGGLPIIRCDGCGAADVVRV